ncbi:MAG TPA: hypothetical protein VL970_09915, partial [Candidatus Acidoferrales bacterium]|nr:hypothetical protein [Candidatus Acidoferrales bacterium]
SHRAASGSPMTFSTFLAVGLIAATVSLATQSALEAFIAHQSVWKTSWIIGSIFMGSVVVNWPAVFDFAAITASVTALYPGTLVATFVLCGICPRVNLLPAVLIGATLGLAICFVEFHEVIPRFPWMSMEHNWLMAASQSVSGGTAAWLLKRIGGRRKPESFTHEPVM